MTDAGEGRAELSQRLDIGSEKRLGDYTTGLPPRYLLTLVLALRE